MEVYIVIVFAIVCTISQFSQIVIADLVPVHVKEFVEFCENNGHKFLTIFDDGNSTEYQRKNLLMKLAFNHNLRIRIVNTEADLFSSTGNMDTVIFDLTNQKYLKPSLQVYIHIHKRQKAIVIVNNHQLENFQEMSVFHNSLFYLLTFDFPSTFIWYTVMTFHDSSHMIMNRILFDKNGLAIEDYNLHGYEIVAATLDWMPFSSHKNCNSMGRKCQNSGLLVDQMNVWAQDFNFTWDVMTGFDNDWGLRPKSGPFNISGNWSGVMGDVITGKYHMSLSSWLWPIERDPMLDHVPVVRDNEILVLSPTPPSFDLYLYIKPFRVDAWQGVGFYLLISIFFWLNIPNRLIEGYSNMTTPRIVKFQLYLTWFLMHSHYGGSMKAAFATDIILPFDNLRDVLKAFPSWNLVYMHGNSAYFEVLASQGDQDYSKYWNEVENHPDKHIAPDIWDGLERIMDGQTILHAMYSAITGSQVMNPKAIPPIKTFGKTRSSYYNIIFTKNSPLIPLFLKAATKTFESGKYDRISIKWKGRDIIQEGNRWSVLSHGQVVFNWILLMCMMGYSLVILILECIYSYRLKQRILTPIFFDQRNVVVRLTKEEK